jgi:hypothetical protein
MDFGLWAASVASINTTVVNASFACPQSGDGLVFAQRKSPAWNAAWEALRACSVSEGVGDGTDLQQEHPELHDIWRHMGSTITVEGMAHDSRHRCHPRTEVRESRTVTTEGWSCEGEADEIPF